jgi:zinc transport system permease protein
MAVLAGVFGVVAVGGGLYASFGFDTPSGPSIVATAAAVFALLLPAMIWQGQANRRR